MVRARTAISSVMVSLARQLIRPKHWLKHVEKKKLDERWLEWLDSKIALLINREGIDPRDYGGKSYDE